MTSTKNILRSSSDLVGYIVPPMLSNKGLVQLGIPTTQVHCLRLSAQLFGPLETRLDYILRRTNSHWVLLWTLSRVRAHTRLEQTKPTPVTLN